MKNVSEQWSGTVATAHHVITRVMVGDANGDQTEVFPTSGTVTLDATAEISGRFDLVFHGEDAVPLNYDALLAPYGNEVVIQRGVVHPDGTEEYVQLGVFGIEDAEISDSGPELSVAVSGLDRSRRLQYAQFEAPYQIPSGTVISQGILDTCLSAWPGMPYEADLPTATTLTLPKVIASEGDDRWAFVKGMAEAMGMVLFFNAEGQLALRPYISQSPVTEVVDGENGLLVSMDRKWSREQTFNRVIATGENTETNAVYRAVATDSNPQSQTYYDGPFGHVPTFYASPYIQSDAQAFDAASAILAQEIGTTASIDFGMIPNPALEPNDSVLVCRERTGVDEVHILDAVSIGLGAEDAMTCTTREYLIS